MANNLTKHVTHWHIKVPLSRFAVLFLPQHFHLKRRCVCLSVYLPNTESTEICRFSVKSQYLTQISCKTFYYKGLWSIGIKLVSDLKLLVHRAVYILVAYMRSKLFTTVEEISCDSFKQFQTRDYLIGPDRNRLHFVTIQ